MVVKEQLRILKSLSKSERHKEGQEGELSDINSKIEAWEKYEILP